MPTIPSSIKDMDCFIERIRNIIDLRSDVLLATFDVVSLYCGIRHDFALCALKDFLLDRNLPAIVVNGIHNMMELVLKRMCLNLTMSVSFKLLADGLVLCMC